MGKFILRFFLIVLIVIVSVVIFLTYFGLETDKFDNLIKNKTNEINQNVKLEFRLLILEQEGIRVLLAFGFIRL